MAQPAVLLPPLESDHIIHLRGVGWADYQRLLEIRGERSVPRLTYLSGVLELMSPSKSHESIKSMIGRLVEAWCMSQGVDISPYGSWTIEDKQVERGVEPDECYVLGDNPDAERPDLAIEVIWTSGSVNKLEVYRKLGVKEVWVWKAGKLAVHALHAEQYESRPSSDLLRGIDLDLLLQFVEEKPMTRAVRQYQQALAQKALGPQQT